MPEDATLRAVFKKPAKEVVAYFAAKRAQPSEGWETVSAAEHQRAFTVAQTAGFNVLGDMQEALQRARDEGWSRAKFTEHLEPLLRAKGWWGKAIDPATGEILQHYPGSSKPVEYGSPARLRLVHDSNVATSYGAGRYQRQLASKAALPYLRYIALLDTRTRKTHAALNGQVWPVEHPIIARIYPPNGCRCRCMMQALRADEVPAGMLNEGGEAIEKFVPVNAARAMRRVQGWRAQDGREIYPDVGWDVAPGNGAHLTQLGQSLERLPLSALPAASRAIASGQAFALWRKAPSGNFPIAVLPPKDAYRIGQKEGSRSVLLSPETMAKQEREHGALTNEEYALVQQAILQGEVIQEDNFNLIYTYQEGKQVVVIKAKRSGDTLFLTSMRKMHARVYDD